MKWYLFSIVGLFVTSFISCDSSSPLVEIEPIEHPYKFSSEIKESIETSSEPWKYQLAAWDYANIGDYDNLLKTWDLDRQNERKADTVLFNSLMQSHERHEALKYILDRADTSQIVIINEAHHQPLHRVFTSSLLKGLYDQGYRYLGLETLDVNDSDINERNYPLYSSGTYTIEPQFGDMVRSALQLGYHLFGYESEGNGREREIGQAQNIAAVMEKDPNVKYLIHCGFAHAVEGKYSAWGKAMAGRLKEFTGINPLTINQTEFTEKSKRSYEHPLFQNLELSTPSVFVDSDGQSFKHPRNDRWFDIMIFHARTNFQQGRPNWLFSRDKKEVEIDLENVSLSRPYFVMAFVEGEDYTKSVPCDLVEIKDDRNAVGLSLADGAYNIIFQNQNQQSFLKRIVVN